MPLRFPQLEDSGYVLNNLLLHQVLGFIKIYLDFLLSVCSRLGVVWHVSLRPSVLDPAGFFQDYLVGVGGVELVVYAVQVSDLLQVWIVFHYLPQSVSLVLDRVNYLLLELDLLVDFLLVQGRPGDEADSLVGSGPACLLILVLQVLLVCRSCLLWLVNQNGLRGLRSRPGVVVVSLRRLVLLLIVRSAIRFASNATVAPFLVVLLKLSRIHGRGPLLFVKLRGVYVDCSLEDLVRKVTEVNLVNAVLLLRVLDQV